LALNPRSKKSAKKSAGKRKAKKSLKLPPPTVKAPEQPQAPAAEVTPRPVGHPPHEPSAQIRKTAETMAAYRVPFAEIAVSVGLSLPTLTKYYGEGMVAAKAKLNARIAGALITKALNPVMSGPSVSAGQFLLRNQDGFKDEPKRLEHSGPGGTAIPVDMKGTAPETPAGMVGIYADLAAMIAAAAIPKPEPQAPTDDA
jgi:hypothetical protein